MADHDLKLELYYSGAYQLAPVLTRDAVEVMRGAAGPSGDLDPASASATIDNTSGAYAPLSVRSALHGLIGQNTRARLSADGSALMTGEVSLWRPERPVKGSGWTKVVVSGVLRRLGRGTDPIDSAVVRSILFSDPIAYWPLEGGPGALTDGTAPLSGVRVPDVTWNDDTRLVGSLPLAKFSDEAVEYPDATPALSGRAGGTSASGWSVGCWMVGEIVNTTGQFTNLINWGPQPIGSTSVRAFRLVVGSGVGFPGAFVSMDDDSKSSSTSAVQTLDGVPHHLLVTAEQTSANNVEVILYIDGVIAASVDAPSSPYTLLPVDTIDLVPDLEFSAQPSLWLGHVAVWDRVLDATEAADLYAPGDGYDGEAAGRRFLRFCEEEGLDAAVVGDADDTVAMGPQVQVPRLEVFEDIARTDAGLIFETRDALGLTLRTGVSLLNQTPAATVNYIGDVVPPLRPVVGDVGIRNDVSATSPSGASRRVQQLEGPHNVQLPEDDPQGVGRYRSSIDANPATDDGLADAAGWRVNLGTFDGTWYDTVEVDLDAAPHLVSTVDALDIGDVLSLAMLPEDDALDVVEVLIVGRRDKFRPKRRTVVFYCVPAAPYRVGVLAETSGDTDPFVGHAESDGAVTSGATAAGAASFNVAIASGPLWTTVADDFPQDVIVGGQRVSISGVTGASSPQAFTVSTAAGAYPIVYAIPAGSAVTVQQPAVTTL